MHAPPLHLPSMPLHPQACSPFFTPSLPPLFTPSLSSQSLYGFTIATYTTSCNSGSTWSSTGLSPCTRCSTCLESGFRSVCNRNADAVCNTAVQQRSAVTVNLALVAAGSVSDYNEQTKTNLQIQFALAAGVRTASTLSFSTPPCLVTPPHHSTPTSPLSSPHLSPPGSPVLRRCPSRCRLRDHHSSRDRSRRLHRHWRHERSQQHTWLDFGRQLLPRNHCHFRANIHER